MLRGQLLWFVPEYDEREACNFNGYTWTQWVEELTGWEKAKLVAYYRMHHLVEAHVNDAISIKMEHQAKANGRR